MQIGIEVDLAELRDKLGLNAPKAGAQILGRPAPPPPNPRFAGSKGNQNPSETSDKYHLKGLKGKFQGDAALQAQEPSVGRVGDIDPATLPGNQLGQIAIAAMPVFLAPALDR